ncbi:hypothetical protein ACFFMP_01350 [Pseudoroseomonas cervicalis]|uniref:Uncharacterized protein n=1 Tax=Pseudoroseomonas cervicalis ATCC 49957 TaxID=525371 RepID=D5RJ61_9PROT|nr:hypothetical protein [Pseudoroseomonas cervicalis]EFH12659.1 hypothetical protein HMPREF0731_1121 [Pseudoroseomonas cervicalis ATCC 49957]
MSARLWSIGVLLVALGIAASVVGWDALLWLPRQLFDSLAWAPRALFEALRDSPATTGIILLGVVLMVAARLLGRRGS